MERERTLFSNNRKVSIRQMKRLLFLELFGISSLILPGLMARFCQTDGIFAIALGAAAAGGLIKWLLNQAAGRIPGAEGADEPSNGKAGSYGRRFWIKSRALLLLALFCLAGGFLLFLLTAVIENQLLDAGFIWIILGTLLAAGGYGIARGIECRARIYEILFWFLVIPLLIMLAIAAIDVDPDYWLPVFACGWKNFFLGTAICFGFFMLSLLSLCMLPFCAKPKEAGRAAASAIRWTAVLDIGLYLILLGIFQPELLMSLKYPAISLMAMAQIPGGLFERQDALMTAIWFFSLFALFNSFIFYGVLQTGRIWPGKKEKKEGQGGAGGKTGKIRIGIVLFLILLAAVACLLNGCGLKEPEQRLYPLALGVSQAEEGYDISYAWPVTSGNDSSTGAASPDAMETFKARSLFEGEQEASENTDRVLDFNHLKALVLDTSVLAKTGKMEELLAYFIENENMAWNTCVFVMDDASGIFEKDMGLGKSLGIYLEELVQSRDDRKEKAITTIKDLIDQYAQQQGTALIPQLSVKDGKPVITAYRVYSAMHDHGTVSAKDAWMADLLMGNARYVSLTLEDGTYITVNHIRIERSIAPAQDGNNGRTPVETMEIRGNLEISGSTVMSAKDRQKLRGYAQEQIQTMLNDFCAKQREQNKVDITDSFQKLAGYDRTLWELYRNNPEAYGKKLHTDIRFSLKLLTA